MTNFLIKLFIKDYENVKESGVRSAYGKLSGAVGIAVNLILCALKFFTGIITRSVAVTADAVNNLSDAGSSVVTLFGFKLSEKPADSKHPYGHGRIEYIAGLIVSFLVLLMGFELINTSVGKIREPTPVEYSTSAVIILAASIIAKLWLALFNSKLGKKINSTATKAVVTDSISDTVSTGAVLVSVIISKFCSVSVDGYFGLAVALFIIYSGVNLVRETVAPLLGMPPEKEFYEEIKAFIMSYDSVIGVHDLIIHDYGPSRLFASAHAEVPANLDFMIIHDTIDLIERDIFQKYGMMISIHADPVIIDDERINSLKEMTQKAVSAVDGSFSIHDFRVVEGVTHTNLIFDVEANRDCKLSSREIENAVCSQISKIDERYLCVVTVDYTFD